MSGSAFLPACHGLRVVELAEGAAGPLVGMLFADNGAEVIKIERPGGDWARPLAGFRMWNRGKKSVVLDAHSSADHEALWEIIAQSDVLVDGFRPGVLERLGFGWNQVNRRCPGLIYCSITGFGALSKYANLPGYEGIVLAKAGKMVGLDRLSGAAAENVADHPLFSAAPIASYGAGQLAFQGALAALLARERTGRGERVTTSLLQGLSAAVMRLQFKRSDEDEETPDASVPDRAALLRGIMVTFLVAECKDGRYIQMCARQDSHFRNWLTALGLEAVLSEERYAKAPMGIERLSDIEALEALIRAKMLERTQQQWMDLFISEFDVGADPFLTFDEFLVHPQMTENSRVVTIEDDEVGPCRQLGPLVLFEKTRIRLKDGAPRLGANTDQVLAALARQSEDQSTPSNNRSAGRFEGMNAPLDGVTVIELAYFLAAPLGPTLLAELGARVIKIEPFDGDPYRRVGIEAGHILHGKESIAIDLKQPAGQELLRALLARADAFVHNFRPGVVERLGCDYQAARAVNPRLVYLYGASYGSKGAQSHRPAFHSTPTALSGAGIFQAGEGNAPVDDAFPDPCAGIAVASALLLGLWARERTGEGQYMETTMLASAGYVHADNLVEYRDRPPRPDVDGAQSGLHTLYRLYPCCTGWIFLAVVRDDEWTEFVKIVDRPELSTDPRFSTRTPRLAYDTELSAILADLFETRSADEWELTLSHYGLGTVRADSGNIESFFADEGLLLPAEHPQGPYWRMGPRVEFAGRPNRLGGLESVGASTVPILEELGFGDAEITHLCMEGVVLDGRLR